MLLQDAGLHRLEAVAIRTPRDDTLQPHHLRSTGEPHPADYAPDPRLSDIARLRTIELEQVPSVWHPRMNRLRLAAVCLASFLNGFSDAGAGAIIPYMEEYYGIGYAVVSLIFVGQAVGYVFAAIFLDILRVKFGRASVLAIGNISLLLGYIPAAVGAPYALVAVAFFLVGFGAAVNMALGNIFCGGLQNGTLILGLLHGCYGIGGTISPLIATTFVVAVKTAWHWFYLLPLGFSILTLLSSMWVFRGYEQGSDPVTREGETTKAESAFLAILSTLRMRVVLLGAVFIFAYQGAEVSISGWVISFLIDARGGDPAKVGYVSAGFWAGITIGRFALSGPAQRWGERYFVYGFTVVSLAFELLVWLVPNVIGNAIAVSIVGLAMGPIYPCAAAVFMRNMTRQDSLRDMVAISASGSLGGAMAPFLTGLLAQEAGTFVLHPIVISLLGVMLACWYGIPGKARRDE